MSFYIKKNNVDSTLSSLLNDTDLTLIVADGADFPSTYCYVITVWDEITYPDSGNDPNMEVMIVSNKSTNTLTVARGAEGTTGVEHPSGSTVAMLITEGLFNDPTYGIESNIPTTIAELDTTATGAELDILTGGAQTALHSHAGGSGDINNGGNSFGAETYIGTNDAYPLGLKSNNITTLFINDNSVEMQSGIPFLASEIINTSGEDLVIHADNVDAGVYKVKIGSVFQDGIIVDGFESKIQLLMPLHNLTQLHTEDDVNITLQVYPNVWIDGYISFEPLGSAPGGIPSAGGTIYFDNITKKHRAWDGSSWRDLY